MWHRCVSLLPMISGIFLFWDVMGLFATSGCWVEVVGCGGGDFFLLGRIGDDGLVGVGEGVGEIVRSISGMVCDSAQFDGQSMVYCKK